MSRRFGFPASAACGAMLVLTACASSPDPSAPWRSGVVQQVSSDAAAAAEMRRRCAGQPDLPAGEDVAIVRYRGVRSHLAQAIPADPQLSLQPGDRVLVDPGACLLHRPAVDSAQANSSSRS